MFLKEIVILFKIFLNIFGILGDVFFGKNVFR